MNNKYEMFYFIAFKGKNLFSKRLVSKIRVKLYLEKRKGVSNLYVF